MTLTDTGPLVAIVDSNDANHQRCIEAARAITLPLITTVACFTEAMYLLGRSAGAPGQNALWEYRNIQMLQVTDLATAELDRAREYMRKFQDVPCDFADATVLVLAERLGSKFVLTLDGHFNAYRVRGKALTLAPGPRST